MATANSLVAQNADPAMERFKEDVARVDAWIAEQREVQAKNPLLIIIYMRSLASQFRSVRTDGLPEDLKEAFESYTATVGGISEKFRDWPEGEEELMTYVRKSMGEDSQFANRVRQLLADWAKQGEIARQRFQTVVKKYGLTGLERI